MRLLLILLAILVKYSNSSVVQDSSCSSLSENNNYSVGCGAEKNENSTYFEDQNANINSSNNGLTLFNRSHDANSWFEKQQIVKQAFHHAWRSEKEI